MNTGRNKKHLGLRIFCSVCLFTFLGALIYAFIFDFEMAAVFFAITSFCGLAGTSLVSSDSFLEFLSVLIELFVEGIVSAFEALASTLGSIFG